MLVSADMAHNLGDIFEKEVGGEIAEAGEGLFLLELDPYRMMRREFPHYGYQTDGVYINRLLPDIRDNPFLSRRRELQQWYVKELEEVFEDDPITRLPWYPQEIKGPAAVERMSLALPEEGLFDVRVHTENEVYRPIDDGYRLCLRLPAWWAVFVSCARAWICGYRWATRRVPLPDSLRDAVVADVSLEQGTLEIDPRRKEGGEAGCGS